MDQGDLLINCCQNTFYVIDDDLVVNFQVRLGYDVVFNNVPENLLPGKSYFVSASLSIFDQYNKVGLFSSLDPQVVSSGLTLAMTTFASIGFVFVVEQDRNDISS